MKVPETITTLPQECIIISYAGKPEVLRGTTMSIGAVYTRWSAKAHPFDRHDKPFRSEPSRTFFHAMRTEGAMPPATEAFWAPHPQSRQWSTGDTRATDAWGFFFIWCRSLEKTYKLPLVLVAAPHSYDAQHIMLGWQEITEGHALCEPPEHVLYADCAELYATYHHLELAAGKAEWKELFMPKNLLHEPVFDSLAQLNALFAGLLYRRPTT